LLVGRGQVLWIAALGGTPTTPYGSHIGTLAVGKAADLVPIDWDKLAYPISTRRPRCSTRSSSGRRATGVDLVMVAGEVVYEGGRFTRVDRAAALRELHASLQHALSDDEIERRALSKGLLPHVRHFYDGISTPKPTSPITARARGFEAASFAQHFSRSRTGSNGCSGIYLAAGRNRSKFTKLHDRRRRHHRSCQPAGRSG
jgi:hypothetical protein